ncbi:MAG TPA: DUF6325 family protein [Acidimicrobiales bacterium]|nr:DUF6325 family protein [Acidimicrobiales bacterium]
MTDARHPRRGDDDVVTDLVEYLIVAVADRDALAGVVPALAELVESATVRILDVVALVRDEDGTLTVLELEEIGGPAALGALGIEAGGMLSEHDLELASFAIHPGGAGIVVVTEDRWAEPLSAAARQAGGQIIAGERIPPARVEAALAERADESREGA